MKHQIRVVIDAVSRAAELALKEAEGRLKEIHGSETEDPLSQARELDYAEHRLNLSREYCRGIHVLGDAIAGDVLKDPVPDRGNEHTQDPIFGAMVQTREPTGKELADYHLKVAEAVRGI